MKTRKKPNFLVCLLDDVRWTRASTAAASRAATKSRRWTSWPTKASISHQLTRHRHARQQRARAKVPKGAIDLCRTGPCWGGRDLNHRRLVTAMPSITISCEDYQRDFAISNVVVDPFCEEIFAGLIHFHGL